MAKGKISNKLRIFAHNGSLLAHAHRDPRPIRLARTESATFSAAYISYVNGHGSRTHSEHMSDANERSERAEPGSIVYESRTSNHMTIITPIAAKVLLAVTGYIASEEAPDQADEENEDNPDVTTAMTSPPASPSPPSEHSDANGFLEASKSLLEELGSISQQLTIILREEMSGMRWPDGA